MRRSALAASAALLLALAAGCGSGSSSTTAPPTSHRTPTNVLLTAATATRKAGSAHIAMDMTMPSQAGTVQAHATGDFRMDGRALGDMRMHMSVPSGQSVDMEERLVGTVIYMRSPIFARALAGGRSWIKLDLSEMGSAGSALGSLMSNGQNDPTQALSYLQATSNSVQNLGGEQVGGVETTHYHAIVDFQKGVRLMEQRVPASQRGALRKLYRQIEAASSLATYPVDAWIDGAGRVRRMQMSLPTPDSAETMDMTLTMSRFGEPVHVAAPPASSVTDVSALAAQAQ